MSNLTLSPKQKLALDILDNPQITEVYWGGSAGSGKTIMLCIWMLLRCRQYPGIRIGLGRKELTRLKQTTMVTLMREAHPLLGVTPASFVYQDQKGLITYSNGSSIQLVDLARQPSDPDFDTLGSYNFESVCIEEAGEIHKKAKDIFGSRKNRFMNREHNLVGKTVLTGNPSQNFTRDEYYEPYKALGGGDFQKWESGQVEVNGQMMAAYKAFIKALPTDNPFLPRNYIEVLNNLPPQERKRLRDGDWNYMSDEDSLFNALLLDRSVIGELSDGISYIGCDIADKGKDKTLASLIVDGVLKEQKRLQVDTTGEKPISELYALELIKFAQQRGFAVQDAKRIAIEGNGVGVGMRDFMRSKGWYVTVYEATSQSRSKGFYDMSQSMDAGDLRLWLQLETMPELRKQLSVLTYEFDDKLQPVVLQKKKIKEILGYSPDEADSAMISHWIMKGGSNDPSQESWRIAF